MKIQALFLMVLLLPACSILDTRVPEDIIAERAQARLDTLRARDFEASYQYTTPGYRSTENVGQYGTRYSGSSMWTGAQVVRVECEDIEPPQYCKAVVRIDFKAPQFGYSHTHTFEDWVWIGGDWYLYQNLSN
ncbi:MAG: hypothetical protein CME58_06345 [Halieaceae bacterium]|nr:hypothetical protein [Halieaceae bacterium]